MAGTRSALGVALREAGGRLYQRWRTGPLRPRTVLYESFAGAGITCNPAAVFEHLLADPDHADLTHVWALTPHGARSARAQRFADHPRVRFVRYRSAAYFRTLAQASHLVTNVTFPPMFAKRPDQVYLNTWHGTPYKRMGRDVPGAGASIRNTQRNLASADVLLSSGPYMTSTMYAGAYGVDTTGVVEVGSPRVDVQFDPTAANRVRHELAAAGIPVTDGPILLYAPTWREAGPTAAIDDTDLLRRRAVRLAEGLADDGWTVLLRVHSMTAAFATGLSVPLGHLVPEAVATNDLLAATQVLVTDYSSVFFDHLATGGRTCFLTPDIDEYRSTRGLYLTDAELPGPSTRDVEELISWIRDPTAPTPAHARPEDARQSYCAHEDGRASARVAGLLMGPRRTGPATAPIA